MTTVMGSEKPLRNAGSAQARRVAPRGFPCAQRFRFLGTFLSAIGHHRGVKRGKGAQEAPWFNAGASGAPDEELHRRLKYVEQHAAPFFNVSLSEDQQNIICTSVRTGKVRFVEPVDALWN